MYADCARCRRIFQPDAFGDHLILDYDPRFDGALRTPDLCAPIDEATLERNMEALLDSYASQRPVPWPWLDVETFSAVARLRGPECASAARFAERSHAREVVFA